MNITITSRHKKEYLLIESKGAVETKEELFKHSEMLYEDISKYPFKKILIHEPETTFPLDLFPYFDLVKNYIDNFPTDIRELKIAIVIAPEYKEVAGTWETLSISRGLQYYALLHLKKQKTGCFIKRK